MFGSALTEHFDPHRSDVDFLVEFADGLVDRFDAYFDRKESLGALVGAVCSLTQRRCCGTLGDVLSDGEG